MDTEQNVLVLTADRLQELEVLLPVDRLAEDETYVTAGDVEGDAE